MNVEIIKLDDLKHAASNPMVHDQRNREVVRSSLLSFGQYSPLIVRRSTMEVLIGNCRLDEMRIIGWSECYCNLVDVDDKTAAAMILIDNRSGHLSAFNEEETLAMLNELASQGINLDGLGWDQDDIEELAKQVTPIEPVEPENEWADSIRMTAGQREVFERAAAMMREREQGDGDHTLSDGQIVEFLAADYWAAP